MVILQISVRLKKKVNFIVHREISIILAHKGPSGRGGKFNKFNSYLDYRLPAKKLSNTTMNSEILQSLRINTENILDRHKNNYVHGFVRTLDTLNTDLKNILDNDTISLDIKQAQLEKLSEKNQSFDLSLKYNVPKLLSELITKIDLILLDPNKLKKDDISPYLPSSLAQEWSNSDFQKKSYKTKNLVNTLYIFKDFLRILNYMHNSFGLFLIYNFVSFLRSDFNEVKLKEQIEDNSTFTRTITLVNDNFIGDGTIVELKLKRIQLTENLGKHLAQFFKHYKNACLFNIKKELKTAPFEVLQLYKDLVKRYETTEVDTAEQSLKLGILCVFILELIGVLSDPGFDREGVKTPSSIKINKIYADEIFSIPSKPRNLPMVIRPSFWEKTIKGISGNLNYGGYKFNKELNYPAILNHHNKGVTAITKEDLLNINFIQSNYYNVNKKFLSYAQSNFRDIVMLSLRKIPNIEFFIENLNEKDSKSIKIQSIGDLFSKDKTLISLVNQIEGKTLNKSLKNQIASRQDYLFNHYNDIANIFFGLVHAYIVASRFQNYDFYFTVFMDSRGRVYFTPSGSYFGLQTGDFSKALINLIGNRYDYENPLKIENNYSSSNQNYLDYTQSLKKDKEPFSYLCAQNGILPTTVSNDASCSGTSILSGLIGFVEGLVLTNVIVDTKNDLQKKRCIYQHFVNQMRAHYPKDAYSIYSQKEVEQKLEKFKINQDNFISIINECLHLIKDELLHRNHAKQFVMRQNFSETNKGRLDYIYENILTKVALNKRIVNIDKKVLKSFCYYVARWIDQLYGRTFTEISEFCDILKEHFSTKFLITLSSPNNSDFAYKQLLYKTIKVKRPNFNPSGRDSDLSLHRQTNSPDFNKVQISLIANFIHYLDSRLKFSVVNKCRLSGIPLWGNHDCFYVCPTKKSIVLKHYFDSLIELLLSEQVIEHFLFSNDILPSPEFKQLLEKYDRNKKTVMENIKLQEYLMSPFILTS